MSTPTRWMFVYLGLAIGASGIVAACATGGANAGSGDDDDGTGDKMDAAIGVHMDSSMVTIDAPKPIDASVPMPDAFMPPPDAPPGSLFCTSNAQCTTPGECCVTLGGPMGFCAPGTVVLGQCVPIT